jgi:hypothetical protein
MFKDGDLNHIYTGKYFTISEHVESIGPQSYQVNGVERVTAPGFAIRVRLFNGENMILQSTYFLPDDHRKSEHKELQSRYAEMVCEAFIRDLQKAKQEITYVPVQA